MDAVAGWTPFFEEMGSFLRDINRQAGSASESYCEYAIERLETSIRSVLVLVQVLNSRPPTLTAEEALVAAQYSVQMGELLRCLRRLRLEWQEYSDRGTVASSYTAPVLCSGSPGRPRIVISEQQLLYLRSMSFSWVQIAKLLGVSVMTVHRRRLEYGLSAIDDGASITDDELRVVLRQLRHELPSLGQTLVWGRLRSMGIKVTRDKVRHVMRADDPIHTALRWRGMVVQRQPYSVPGPNSLWHLDGHHKLIRWRIVTHCAIDGYSRLVVFCKCSGNNKASTVYDLFLEAVERHGLPSRVRCDQGRENIYVARHMLRHRGIDRRAVLVGSSVHNQRIERLWRDMHRCVTSVFYKLFYYLEYNDLLDPVSNIHLFAIQYVFIPRVNKALRQFVCAWNSHGVRTEHGQTPNQLFTSGSLRLRYSGLTALDFFDSVPESYGTGDDGGGGEALSDEEGEQGVEIPPTNLALSDEQLAELQSSINPLDDSDEFGIDLFTSALELIQSFVQNGI